MGVQGRRTGRQLVKHEVRAHPVSVLISGFPNSGMHTFDNMSGRTESPDKYGTSCWSVHFTLGSRRRMLFIQRQTTCNGVEYKF